MTEKSCVVLPVLPIPFIRFLKIVGKTATLIFSGPELCYVYPDMSTMLVGQFKNGQLVSGVEAQLIDVRPSWNGILQPFFNVKGHNTVKYSPSNKTYIGDGPLILDPMENKYVYVANSTLEDAGRGIFLKRKATKGQIVAFYNGIRMSDMESRVSEMKIEFFFYLFSNYKPF